MTETKQDVFNELLTYVPRGREYDPVTGDDAGNLVEQMCDRYERAADDVPDCPYCHMTGEEKLTTLLPDTSVGTTAALSVVKPANITVAVRGDVTSIPINNCPMCGRHLSND